MFTLVENERHFRQELGDTPAREAWEMKELVREQCFEILRQGTCRVSLTLIGAFGLYRGLTHTNENLIVLFLNSFNKKRNGDMLYRIVFSIGYTASIYPSRTKSLNIRST